MWQKFQTISTIFEKNMKIQIFNISLTELVQNSDFYEK